VFKRFVLVFLFPPEIPTPSYSPHPVSILSAALHRALLVRNTLSVLLSAEVIVQSLIFSTELSTGLTWRLVPISVPPLLFRPSHLFPSITSAARKSSSSLVSSARACFSYGLRISRVVFLAAVLPSWSNNRTFPKMTHRGPPSLFSPRRERVPIRQNADSRFLNVPFCKKDSFGSLHALSSISRFAAHAYFLTLSRES